MGSMLITIKNVEEKGMKIFVKRKKLDHSKLIIYRFNIMSFCSIQNTTTKNGGNVLIACDTAGRVLELALVLDSIFSSEKEWINKLFFLCSEIEHLDLIFFGIPFFITP